MIADNYLQLRTELETALGKLLRLSSEMRRDAATLDTLHGLLTDVREPLLFVVVGEVKAGKWMCCRPRTAFTFFATARRRNRSKFRRN
jgi:hypothetical protein